MSDVQLHSPIDFNKIGSCPPRVTADRYEPVFELIRGKRVLNVGCCGSDATTTSVPIHKTVSDLTSYCLGIDIFEAGVERLKREGLNAVVANAEDFDLPEKDFDVAVLGDVIEHVGNPGSVLSCCFAHLRPGGQLIVTTPNAFSVSNFTANLLRGRYYANSEHVLWFDPGMLAALLARCGFEVEQLLWTQYDPVLIKRLLQRIRPSLMGTFGLIARKPMR